MRIRVLSLLVGLSLAVCGPATAQYRDYPPPPVAPGDDDWQPMPPGYRPPPLPPPGTTYDRPPGPFLPLLPPLEPILRPPAEIFPGNRYQQAVPDSRYEPAPPSSSYSSLPREYQPEENAAPELPANLKRQLVQYPTREPAGTIVIDTKNTYLYLVLGDGSAMRYGIGVGREGFTWAGAERISRMAEWPDWHPPAEMIERQPYLPRFMAGSEGNPLGARALYLGKTLYRIHGTNQPSTIGTFVSSGCIRLVNADIEDLYRRVKVGTRVVVLPGDASRAPAAMREQPRPEPRVR